MLMAQRLRIDAVHSITSSEVHMSQTCWPYDQRPITSYATARGITSTATRRSETARDTMRKRVELFLEVVGLP